MAGEKSNTDLVKCVVHGTIPSRDILLAYDQLRRISDTFEKIDMHISDMRKSALCKKQA